jgi:hypothetical protein
MGLAGPRKSVGIGQGLQISDFKFCEIGLRPNPVPSRSLALQHAQCCLLLLFWRFSLLCFERAACRGCLLPFSRCHTFSFLASSLQRHQVLRSSLLSLLLCPMYFYAECCWVLYSGNWCCGVDNSSGNGELRDCIAVRDCQRQRDKGESGGRKRREGGYGGHAMAMAGSATCPCTRASYQLSVSYSCSRKGLNRLGSRAWLLGLRRQRSRFLFPRLSLCMACFSQVPILQPVVRTVLGEKFLFRLLESDRVAQSESLCALFTWMDTFDSFYSLFFVCSQCLALSRVRC